MATAPADTATDANDAPVAGIAFMCAGVLCLTINDVFAKWLGTFYPVVEVAFLRMLFALPLIIAAALMFAGPKALVTRRPLAQVGRGLLATVATLTFYLGLTLLPLAEVTAIAFTAPLFGAYLEREGLLVRDIENSYLQLEALEDSAMNDLRSHSITYRIAVGPQAGRKAFTLQTVPAREEDSDNSTLAKTAGFS